MLGCVGGHRGIRGAFAFASQHGSLGRTTVLPLQQQATTCRATTQAFSSITDSDSTVPAGAGTAASTPLVVCGPSGVGKVR